MSRYMSSLDVYIHEFSKVVYYFLVIDRVKLANSTCDLRFESHVILIHVRVV